jgi:outer membrane protein assembly factor BamA
MASVELTNHRFTVRLILSALFVPLLCQSILQAQVPSRAELLEAEREAKVEEVRPPERTTIERGMRAIEKAATKYEKIKGRDPGLHFSSGNFPTGSGLGFGLGYTYSSTTKGGYSDPTRPNQFELKLDAAYTTRNYYEGTAEIRLSNVASSIFNMAWRARYHEDPQEDFFGLGPQSDRGDRTNYLLRAFEGTTEVWVSPIKGFRLGGGATYLTPSVGTGRNSRYASAEKVFDPATIPGFEGGKRDFLRADAFVEYDRRDNPSYPRSGTYLGTRFSHYSDRDLDRLNFRRYEFDAQQYIPFDNGYKVVALASNVVLTDTDGNNAVPFYFMPELGGRQRLRGFREHRFRDRNSIFASAEYRWEAWWAMDVALFADAGKVAARRSDINLKDLESTYGIGFRFHTRKAFTFRLDLAHSREGFLPIFSAHHAF